MVLRPMVGVDHQPVVGQCGVANRIGKGQTDRQHKNRQRQQASHAESHGNTSWLGASSGKTISKGSAYSIGVPVTLTLDNARCPIVHG